MAQNRIKKKIHINAIVYVFRGGADLEAVPSGMEENELSGGRKGLPRGLEENYTD